MARYAVTMLWVACAVLGGWPLGCSTSSGSSSKGTAIYGTCNASSECASGLCASTSSGAISTCAQPCGSGKAACPSGGACGRASDGSSVCLSACTGDATDEYVCSDGAPVSCAVADPSHCDVCTSRCPNTQRCIPGHGCAAKASVGDACTMDSDCSSNNCGSVSHLCRVPVGQNCGQNNCDLCLQNGSFSYCTRPCEGDMECNGGICLGIAIAGAAYTCAPSCSGPFDTSCPGSCTTYSGSNGLTSGFYCACSCSLVPTARHLGQLCAESADCASGDCFHVLGPASSASGSPHAGGMCTRACTSNSDCGPGFACVDLPCSSTDAGKCSSCAALCGDAGTCDNGTCQDETRVDGSSGKACDIRLPNGGDCYTDDDCYSGRCAAERCVPSSGADNGGSCVNSTDCASGNCASGTCKGSALVGNPCTSTYDCAVGQCCHSVCATSC